MSRSSPAVTARGLGAIWTTARLPLTTSKGGVIARKVVSSRLAVSRAAGRAVNSVQSKASAPDSLTVGGRQSSSESSSCRETLPKSASSMMLPHASRTATSTAKISPAEAGPNAMASREAATSSATTVNVFSPRTSTGAPPPVVPSPGR